MRRIAINLGAGFLLAYILGSFIDASFNPADWDQKDRAFLGFFSLLAAMTIAAMRGLRP